MNPAPHRIDNLEIEKFELIDFLTIKAFYLVTKGGAG